MEKNLYEELGLKRNATKSEIKSSYRSLVKQHHPDAGGEKERFLAIQKAWETLKDPVKKDCFTLVTLLVLPMILLLNNSLRRIYIPNYNFLREVYSRGFKELMLLYFE